MSRKVVGDLSKLPASGFRSHSMWYWAGAGFMLIESAGFALAAAAYLYLMQIAEQWPLVSPPPQLVWGTVQTLVLLASLYPNALLSKAARRRDKLATRQLALVMAAFGVAAVAVRGLEFTSLNTRWDLDAYGSITWALIWLHTLHIVTDFIDTAFLAMFLFTHPIDNERLSDVDDNCVYWTYVVLTWLPLYALVYWAPRWVP